MQHRLILVKTIWMVFAISIVKIVNSVSRIAIARAIPEINLALTGTPMYEISGISRIQCLEQCIQSNCSSFNYGQNQCELLPAYICDDTENLYARALFKHYDVEKEDLIELADAFRQETDCVTSNRCSPKCYMSTSSAAPTTTTTLTPTTTTVGPTITTTTTPTPTTTTAGPTTTTTTIITTTQPTTAPATAPPPGPGEVGYACSVNTDCTTPNSDCRKMTVCECVAGYSYNPPTKTCVTTCPGAYGNDFTSTVSYYLFENNMATYDVGVDENICKSLCISTPGCISIEFDGFLMTCSLSTVTKYGNEGVWMENFFFTYFQRDCA